MIIFCGIRTYILKKRCNYINPAFQLTPRVGLEPTTPRLTAVCSTIDTVTYRKISLIECYVQITIEAILFTLFGYHLTGDLTNSILTQLLSFGKREFYVFENFLLFYNAVHKYP